MVLDSKNISNMPNIFLVIVKIKFKALQEDFNLLHIECKMTCLTNFSWSGTDVALIMAEENTASESMY